MMLTKTNTNHKEDHMNGYVERWSYVRKES